tara:strand:- start:90 stop:818 length:729 start_codon:yes stop_codon:yes gene_type:complete
MRIIARLDIKTENLIKPIQLEGLRIIGNPSEYARKYYDDGVDELILIDTVATLYGRNHLTKIIKNTSDKVFIPITVSGGIRTLEDAEEIFNSGADKISINTAAIEKPDLIDKFVKKYGSQSIVISMDVKKVNETLWECFTYGGREKTNKNVLDWCKEVESRGAGEVFVTSIDKDGTKKGLDIKLGEEISKNLNIPLIFGGGLNREEEIEKINFLGNCDGLSVGSAIHYNITTIKKLKSKIFE